MGYDWRSIAIASNISMRTGDSVRDILAMTNTGLTWPQIARNYGLNPKDVIDVSSYPFRRDEPKSAWKMEERQMMTPAPGYAPTPGMPMPGGLTPAPVPARKTSGVLVAVIVLFGVTLMIPFAYTVPQPPVKVIT